MVEDTNEDFDFNSLEMVDASLFEALESESFRPLTDLEWQHWKDFLADLQCQKVVIILRGVKTEYFYYRACGLSFDSIRDAFREYMRLEVKDLSDKFGL